MITGRDIIVLSIQAWDIEIGSNCKNIALQFAKKNRVLYVNPPLDRITSFRNKGLSKIKKRKKISKGLIPDIEVINENLYNLYPKTLIESINWISPHSFFKILNRRNSRLLANDIKSALKRLDFKDVIIFNDSSMFLGLHLKEYLNPNHYTYYVRDYLIKVPYWEKHGKFVEPQLIKKADLILNNSDHYTEYSQQYNKNSFMIGQGCDFSLFNGKSEILKIPDEFNSIPLPIIGYVGSLTSLRLDIELIEHIAKTRKDWSIVLVGPEDENFKNSKLHKLSNVFFLGSKNSDDLPSYIKGFDVAINPQEINDITVGNYPRKIDEYLAMGKPIVATATKAMNMFKDHVYLASTKEEYILLIEKALRDNSDQLAISRMTFAKSHTWENNILLIYNRIIESIKMK